MWTRPSLERWNPSQLDVELRREPCANHRPGPWCHRELGGAKIGSLPSSFALRSQNHQALVLSLGGTTVKDESRQYSPMVVRQPNGLLHSARCPARAEHDLCQAVPGRTLECH